MSRRLDDLAPAFRRKVFELIARSAEAGVPLLIVDTLRTPAEQADNLARGVSWTLNSRHLAQAPDGLSLAVDVVPYESFNLYGPDKLRWATDDPAWATVGAIGEALGLRWGGRWQRKDMGHFEEPATVPATDLARHASGLSTDAAPASEGHG